MYLLLSLQRSLYHGFTMSMMVGEVKAEVKKAIQDSRCECPMMNHRLYSMIFEVLIIITITFTITLTIINNIVPMGYLSFLSPSHSDPPSAAGEVFTAVPSSLPSLPPSSSARSTVPAVVTSTAAQTPIRPQEATPIITLPTPQPSSPSTDPVRQRKEVNPNASLYIFSIAGVAFAGGLFLGIRKARRIKFEPHQIEAALANEPKHASSNNLNMPKVTAAPTGGSPMGQFSKPGRTSSVLSRGGSTIKRGTGKLPHERPMDDLSAVGPIPPPKPRSAASPSPLFPASSKRASPLEAPSTTSPAPLNPAVRPRAAQQTPPRVPVPTLAQTAKARPTFAQFRQMYADRHKDTHDEGDQADAPPITPGTALYAAQAFGLATLLAFGLVGVPFGAICWWLGVEEPADFTPLFRQKLSVYFPTLGTEYLRPTLPEDPARSPSSSTSSAAAAVAAYVPDFLRVSPTASAASTTTTATTTADGALAPAPHTLVLPSVLQQGASPEGAEEQDVYDWFERVKLLFEKDRLDEVRRRAEEDREWKAWEEEERLRKQAVGRRV